MAVDNEIHYALDITKGLFNTGSAANNDTPKGFCSLLQNFVADGNRIRVRPNFSTYSNYRDNNPNTTATANLELTDSYKVYEDARRVWAVGGGVNLPTLIWQSTRGTGVGTFGALLSNDVGNAPLSAHGNSNWCLFSAGGNVFYGMNQFASNIYAGTLAAGVKKFSAWNFAAPGSGSGTVTINNVAGSPNTRGLTFFRDRFFGWNNDTIYWTELAVQSPGGLPEVWNTATNFTRVPTNLAGCKVVDVMVFNDRLIVFTSAGLFSLRTLGDPLTSWSWNTIDENIKITAQNQCVQTRGRIYYADDTGVWAYDGDNFQMISATVSNLFDNRFDVNFIDNPYYHIYPTHDGLILAVLQPAAVFTGGGTPWRWDVGRANYYYYSFKWETWCEFNIGGNLDWDDILGAVSDHRSYVHGGQPTNWMLARITPMTSNLQLYEVDFNGFSGELYDRTNTFPVPGTNSDTITSICWTGNIDLDYPSRIKSLKQAFFDTYHFVGSDTTVSYTWYADGDFAWTGASGSVNILSGMGGDPTKFTKFGIPFKFRETNLHFSYTGNDYVEFKEIQIFATLERDELRTFAGETV